MKTIRNLRLWLELSKGTTSNTFIGTRPEICEVKEMLAEVEELRTRATKSLEWMVADMKWRFDQTKQNLDNGSQGGYSPELTEAIALLAELESEVK